MYACFSILRFLNELKVFIDRPSQKRKEYKTYNWRTGGDYVASFSFFVMFCFILWIKDLKFSDPFCAFLASTPYAHCWRHGVGSELLFLWLSLCYSGTGFYNSMPLWKTPWNLFLLFLPICYLFITDVLHIAWSCGTFFKCLNNAPFHNPPCPRVVL